MSYHTKIRSASARCFLASVEKKRFLPRQLFTISNKPGSYIGNLSLFHDATRSGLMSRTVTVTSGHLYARQLMDGPPT
jgi:hypothetical protein